MNKPQSLRNALNKSVAYVRDNPDKLHLFVDNGSLVATGASSISWEYRYTLNVVIEDFSGDQNLLMAPVLLWLRENQLDAINNPELREKLFTFEVDILRNDLCDISLNLQLTECVLVSADGGLSTVEAEPEPDEPEEMWAVKRG
ncbi:phage tail protein [Enterobacter sp. AD2-3]|uniref:phage tail protein n=1 Tax=Enterobacter sp. AD2-3 TaxID=2547834 RepID=UPI00109DF1AA|nr:phage tail protein [Enterobacter sp. AD2-3]THC30325.1 phage tail protein [Enterobacter sp. AD2-3]HDT2789922.1 phage tail protein [Enterobacter asburiae]